MPHTLTEPVSPRVADRADSTASEGVTGADTVYLGRAAYLAELRLGYAVEQDLGFGLLIGGPGLGKSLLLSRLAAVAANAGRMVAHVYFPQLGVDDLLGYIAAEWQGTTVPAGTAAGRNERLRHIADCLAASQEGGLIVIDDAHLIGDPEVFAALQTLGNLRRDGVRLTVLLAGQPALAAELSQQPALAQRMAVTATLAPFGIEEAAAFVRRSDGSVTVTAEALDQIHDLTHGVPRLIERLVAMARIVATAEGRDEVTVADVTAVAGDCGLRDE